MDPIKSIGQKLRGDEQRDAIHIAIMPVICDDWMSPGCEVALVYGTKNVVRRKDSSYGHQTLGVIDPFFGMGPGDYDSHTIKRGDVVWCFLKPGTITGLRHEWTRPDIDNQQPPANEHEKWLREFADRWMFNYDDMIAIATKGSVTKSFDIPGLPIDEHEYECDYIIAMGRDLHSKEELGEDYDKFWQHIEGLTGREFSQEFRMKIGWSCSC